MQNDKLLFRGTDIVLILDQKDYDSMTAYCRKCLPEEACGLLAGIVENETKIIKQIWFLTNTDHSSRHFSMAPEEQFSALKAAREKGYVLLGNFHSHPASPPGPSAEDIRLAYDPEAEYLIVSLAEEKHPVLRAFGIDAEKNVTVHEIRIVQRDDISGDRSV